MSKLTKFQTTHLSINYLILLLASCTMTAAIAHDQPVVFFVALPFALGSLKMITVILFDIRSNQ